MLVWIAVGLFQVQVRSHLYQLDLVIDSPLCLSDQRHPGIYPKGATSGMITLDVKCVMLGMMLNWSIPVQQ